MLILQLYDTSKFGKKTNRYQEIKDKFPSDRWGGKKQNISCSQFILDCTIRDMEITKQKIEDLEAMPTFVYNGENITSQILPIFVEELENHLGKINYTKKRGEKECGTLKYLHEMGVV